MKSVDISVDRLKVHVYFLAGEIGQRSVFLPQKLHQAAEYIEKEWQNQGHEVARQTYQAYGEDCANLEITRPGKSRPNEIVLVGAHYDAVTGSPGANDNGSGVAALLELARVFAKKDAARTVRFVAFVNEEPPFFQTGQMGSQVYAKMARERGDDIRAVISLETIGYYSDEPGSQHYPPFFKWFYPSRGNFIAFVSNLRSRPLLHQAVGSFRAQSDFPIECVATFSGIPGIDWSDHASFWRQGYPAFMVTDTAPYRYPHYHSEEDTPDKIDYASLARVTEGMAGVIGSLADAGESESKN